MHSDCRLTWGILLLGMAAGCENGGDRPAAAPADDLFSPAAMRINPAFTQVADLSHAGKPDGIEAQLEFTDRFGDPTKASGRVLYELFEYRRDVDPRGKRVGGPWMFPIETVAEQKEGWNSPLRSYRFALSDAGIKPDESYVLSAIFELTRGGRFFDRIVLTGRKAEPAGSLFAKPTLPAKTDRHE